MLMAELAKSWQTEEKNTRILLLLWLACLVSRLVVVKFKFNENHTLLKKFIQYHF